MSVMGQDRLKVILPRTGLDEFWQAVRQHYAHRNERKWKQLAMLALRETADWPLDLIALAFGHNAGSIARTLERTKADLRERFRAERRREGRGRGSGAEDGGWKVEDGADTDAA
jgi:hypothetical protein